MSLLAWLMVCGTAHAQELEVEFGGSLQSDLRYRIAPVAAGPWFQPLELPEGFSRNQNTLKLRGRASSGRAAGVMDLDFILLGFSDQVQDLSGLSTRAAVDPYTFDVHSLYFDMWDVGVPGLDLRIGQQVAQFGVGDQFNPTNNLNADDVEDPLRFGDQLGNFMMRADYSPRGNWGLTAVAVPVFKPAMTPASGALGLSAVDRLPMEEEALRWRIHSEQALAEQLLGYGTVVGSTVIELPESTAENIQYGLNLGGSIGMQDVGFSYYRGRTDFPIAVGNHSGLLPGEICPDGVESGGDGCLDGLINTEVTLAYPKMQVLGFNGAGEVNPFGWMHPAIQPLGWRLEFAWVMPEKQDITITNDEMAFGITTQEAGEYDYGLGDGVRPTVVSDAPFAKWAMGLDYTFGRHLYVNAQWVHGMPDEYGAGDWLTDGPWAVRSGGVTTEVGETTACANPLGLVEDPDPGQCAREVLRPRVGDYLVVGADIMWGDTLLRLFTIQDLTPIAIEETDPATGERVRTEYSWTTPEARSMVLYPELSRDMGNGVELAAGALLMIGEPYTKFGDPATGGHQVFTRARYAF